MVRMVDLRSDTASVPTDRMRLAMQRAEIGNDQRGEDPSVNRLEAVAAEKLGKEATVFLPSGTMSNLVAVMSHCARGDRAVLGQLSHILNRELDGITAIAGVMPLPVPDLDGLPTPSDVERAILPPNSGVPRTALVCLENTHNFASGAVATPQEIGDVAATASRRGAKVHLDGARIFNAAVALKIDVRELVRHVDSVCFCLSKGLSAPVGSVLCGSREFITRARYFRKILGGAMLQAGHLAAAGIVALEEMIDRPEEDNANARYLAELVADLPVLRLNPSKVESNIIVFEIESEKMSGADFVRALGEHGVLVSVFPPALLRMVTHRGVSRDDIEYAAHAIRDMVTNWHRYSPPPADK